MPRRVQRETDRFKAEADDGTVYTVVEMTTFTEVRTLSDGNSWVPGSKEYGLSTGGFVNSKGDGVYEIFDTDQVIRKAE